MIRQRNIWLVAAALLVANPAQAGFFEDIFQGLDYLARPSGTPLQFVPGGGRANGQRFGRLRIVPNQPGDGYRLEFDRTFGVDNTGRPEVLDLGDTELELAGSIQSTLEFTRRGVLAGEADTSVGNLNYSLRGNYGVEDIELRGTLNLAQNLDINLLGFYEMRLNVANTDSELLLDGILVEGSPDTDFNVGPIAIRGNIYYDIALAALSSFGVDTTQAEQLFPNSPIDRITEEIRETLADQAEVLGTQISADYDAALQNPGLAESARVYAGDLISAVDLADASNGSTSYDFGPERVNPVPEPASGLLLLAGGAVTALLRRR